MNKRLIWMIPFIPMILLLLSLFLSQAFASNGYSVEFPKTGDTFVKVEGKSMEPAIHDGTIISCIPKNSYKMGDVVAFSYGEILVSHRIIADVSGMLITKGDGNLIPDINILDAKNIICKLNL